MKKSRFYKWQVLSVITLVSFITNVDSTIVVTGLSKMMAGLHLSIEGGLWIITSYIIASTVFLLPAGRWADQQGTKRIFMLGFAIFTAATVLCGITHSGSTMIVYRTVQGVGAALALATATPILLKTFPKEEHGLAISINATSWVVGAIVGPVAGGYLIHLLGWRSVFFVTVPFGVIGLVGAWIVLEASEKSNTAVHIDWKGVLAFATCLTSFMVALSYGPTWGWFALATMELYAATVILGILFAVTEIRSESPLFHYELLKSAVYLRGLAITLGYCVGFFGITFLIIIYLQGALRLSPLDSGLLLLALSAPQLIIGTLGGKLADKTNPIHQLMIGTLAVIAGMLMLGHLGAKLNILSVVCPLILISVANSFAWPALAKTVLSSAPKSHVGAASGIFYTVYNVGRALSQVLVLLAVEHSVSSATVSRAMSDGSVGLSAPEVSSLVHATNSGFYLFILPFVVALLFTAHHRWVSKAA